MSAAAGPDIIENGLVLCLDAANRQSYAGSGTVWSSLVRDLNGTLTNGPTFNSANGGSIVFDGVNDYWVCSQRTIITEFQYNSSFTAEAFAYISENSGTGYIITNRLPGVDGNGTQYTGWALSHDGGRLYGFVGGYPGQYSWRRAAISSVDFTNLIFNKWAHIVFTNTGNAGEQKIFINGINITNLTEDDKNPPYTINYGNGTSRLVVGMDGWNLGSGIPLNSRISLARVYNRALTPAEILQNYNATKSRFRV